MNVLAVSKFDCQYLFHARPHQNNNFWSINLILNIVLFSHWIIHSLKSIIAIFSMFFTRLILTILIILKEMLMVSLLCNNMVKVDISPSTSCEIAADSALNLGNCLQACISSGPFYMVSHNVVTSTCLCCKEAPSGLEYVFQNWISYSIRKLIIGLRVTYFYRQTLLISQRK